LRLLQTEALLQLLDHALADLLSACVVDADEADQCTRQQCDASLP
jgi:hypothetical protein